MGARLTDPSHRPVDHAALIAGVCSFTLWGLFPLFFQAVGRAGAASGEVVVWRILASLPVCALIVLLAREGGAVRELLRDRRRLAALGLSGAMIGINWGVYVWAVQHGQVLATSLGYYINPLLNMAVGAWLFRERLSLSARAALALAIVGVALQAVAIGGAPWIALILASSFCAYGVIRKQVPVAPQTGLMVETALLAVPCMGFLVWQAGHGGGAFGRDPLATALLLASGPVTVVPLLAFSVAARRLTLTLLGFLQFIQPTIVFFLGTVSGEPLSPLKLASFGFIWLGVAVFVGGAWRRR
ncbi:MAG: hypothetical protein B7Y99_08500 [Caulobacterales bacterium 32-69-10]|nr:MAG: hypothetical protein B7Y99_08500 [Caulobacterales bacterium 32-69-10]